MSKKLIAGAGVVAGLAVALAPVASFATASYDLTQQIDTLKVTIEEVCAFGHDYTSGTDVAAGTHTDGNGGAATAHSTYDTAGVNAGKWNQADVNGGASNSEILYGVMENSVINEDFGKTTLNVVCNDSAGYKITATGTDLESGSLDPIAHSATLSTAASSWAFKVTTTNTSGATVAEGFTTWAKTATTGSIITSAADKTTPSSGDAWTITYGVAIDADQPAGTYQGTMTYVLDDLGA